MGGCERRGWDSCSDYKEAIGFINSDKFTKEIKKELVVVMPTKPKYIDEFMAWRHGVVLRLRALPKPDGIEITTEGHELPSGR